MDSIVVEKGTPATLTCTMTELQEGNPLTVTWYMDGSQITNTNGITMDPPDGTPG